MCNITEQYNLYDEVNNPPKYYFEDEVREGFFVSSMMKRFWAAQLKALSEIDRICKKHSLRWFAGYGTLMGAVRHGGYIPWDDDLDICMMREEYEFFLKCAETELPNDYKIITVQNEKEYEFISARINNGVTISFEEEYLKTNFGCPYLTGLDIFPLDGIMKDEDKEKKRVERIRDASLAVLYIKERKSDCEEFKGLIEKIEKDNGIQIKDRDDPFRELILLLDSMYSEQGSKGSEYVAMISNWVRYGTKYRKEWFDHIIYLQFEYVHIPVPVEYEAILWAEYGSYMNVFKGGGRHNYPLYSMQEAQIVGDLGINTFRYTMPDRVLGTRDMAPVSDRCSEMIAMLKQVADKITQFSEMGETAAAAQLLLGSEGLITSLESVLNEKERYRAATVTDITALKDIVAEYSSGRLSQGYNDYKAKMQETLDELVDTIEQEAKKKEVLFLPVKADWWGTLEPEWRQATEDDKNEVFVMPLTYLEKDYLWETGEEKNDLSLFPDHVRLTDIKEYDIARRHPDKIYIQYPYDGYSTTTAIPGFFHSDSLMNHTDELIYVPYFDVDDPESEDDKIISALRVVIEQPVVYNSDKVIVRTEKLHQVYLDVLTSLTGEDTRDYWMNKVSVSTAEGYDASVKAAEEKKKEKDRQIFLNRYKREGDAGKKMILTQLNPAYIVHNGIKAIDRLRNALSDIKAAGDQSIVLFEPHFATEQLMEILSEKEPDTLAEFRSFIEEIRKDDRIIYDEDRMIENMDLDVADVYYGNTGVLGHKSIERGTMTMYMGECRK